MSDLAAYRCDEAGCDCFGGQHDVVDLCPAKVAALEAERNEARTEALLHKIDAAALRAELAAAKAGLEFYRDVDADTFDGDAMAWEAYCHHDMSRRARSDLARLSANIVECDRCREKRLSPHKSRADQLADQVSSLRSALAAAEAERDEAIANEAHEHWRASERDKLNAKMRDKIEDQAARLADAVKALEWYRDEAHALAQNKIEPVAKQALVLDGGQLAHAAIRRARGEG